MNDMTRRAVLTGGAALAGGRFLDAAGLKPAFATPARFGAVDKALHRAVADGDVAGVVAIGATPNGIAFEGASGKANIHQGTSMATDTVFWLLSMTKAITATACMQLIEQGRLRLDQKAGDMLPQLASPKVLEGFDADGKPRLRPTKRPITVRHLLTHTSGYTYANWSEALTRYEMVTGLPDIATLRNAAFDAPLEFDPGDRWEYGISMDWVGKLVEEVTERVALLEAAQRLLQGHLAGFEPRHARFEANHRLFEAHFRERLVQDGSSVG